MFILLCLYLKLHLRYSAFSILIFANYAVTSQRSISQNSHNSHSFKHASPDASVITHCSNWVCPEGYPARGRPNHIQLYRQLPLCPAFRQHRLLLGGCLIIRTVNAFSFSVRYSTHLPHHSSSLTDDRYSSYPSMIMPPPVRHGKKGSCEFDLNNTP
jgi:hypothetical protein